MKNVSRTTNLTVKIGVLVAVSVLLSFVAFPILPSFPFLKIDLGDIPALIGAFVFGPIVGIVIEAIKNVLLLVVKNSGTAGIGEFANFIIGGVYVGTAGLIYARNRTRMNAVISLVVSVVIMVITGILANYFILIPLYSKFMPIDVVNYVIYAVIPFNLIKGILIAVVTIVIYKRVSVLIHAENYNSKKTEAFNK